MGLHADALGAWLDDYVEHVATERVTPVRLDRDLAQAQVRDLGAALSGANAEVGRLTEENVATSAELARALKRIAELEAGPKGMPVLAHIEARGTAVQAGLARRSWADGVYFYCQANTERREYHLAWDAGWDALVKADPKGRPITVSPTEFQVGAFDDWATRLGPEWRKQVVVAARQEAERKIWKLGSYTEDQFRDIIFRVGDRARSHGIRNGVSLMGYTLHPANTWGGEAKLAGLVKGLPIDYVEWSWYCYNIQAWQRQKHLDDLIAELTRIKAFMDKYLPGIPWGVGAHSVTVPVGTPADSPLREDRAWIVSRSVAAAKMAGCQRYGWFDFGAFTDLGKQTGDGQVAGDAALLKVLTSI
jgi:hypothetical protein